LCFRYTFFGIVMSIQLAPDIEAGLRAEAAARGMDVDALIATAVKAYLRETPSPSVPTTHRVPARARSADAGRQTVLKWHLISEFPYLLARALASAAPFGRRLTVPVKRRWLLDQNCA